MTEKSVSTFTEQELKLTAAIYASRPGVHESLEKTGRLPDKIPSGGSEVALKVILRKRGPNLQLSDREQRVYEAILREQRLPGGAVHLSLENDVDGGDQSLD